MKNSIILLALVVVLSYICLIFLPWWSVVVLCFLLCTVISIPRFGGFWMSFLGVFVMYLAVSSYKNITNDHILGDVVASMFVMPSSWIVVLFGAILFALLSGMGGYTGSLLRRIFRPLTVVS